MGYQRAKWHSGLTYRQTCETCKANVTYTDKNLDFRPWYADGFVDCPRCGTHLRHNERFAINPDGTLVYPAPEKADPKPATAVGEFTENFCHNCGNKFGEGHRFCNACGTKRS